MTTLDRWINQGKEIKEKRSNKSSKLPVGAVSVYFKEKEGFTFRYDSRTYENRLLDLITNLTVLSKIWNRLIQLNLSPRYLSKAYDDDIYAIVIDVINDREGETEMKIEGFKVAVSKHRIGAKILDLARNEPEIPADAIEKLRKRKVYFENPMLQYQIALDRIRKEKELMMERMPNAEYSLEYIKKVIESDPWIFDPRFQKLWYRSEFSYAYEHDDWHTNSGHFNHIAPYWKRNGGDPEEFLKIISKNKEKHLRTLLKYWEEDLEQYIKFYQEYKKAGDIENARTWKQHAIECLRELNMIREELHLPPISLPKLDNP